MIKVGIKFGPRSSREDFEKLVKKADFVELYGKVGFDYSFIKQYSKPVTVHAPHSGEGVNLADKDKVEFNKNALEWARKTGDEFESNTIIIHGELLVGEGDSLDNTIDFLKKNFDERYCIENMPYMSEGFRHIGTTPDDIARVMKETGVGFCLDLAHAAELAMYNNEDVAHLIKKFLGLSPRYYHLSDAKMGLILSGKVKVNGKEMRNVAERIDPEKDIVNVFGKDIKTSKLVYYALYKPVGITSSTEDRHAEKLVTELVPNEPKVWPVGRLDKNTSGLIILTNDGELTQKLTHPKNKIEKEYSIITNIPLPEKSLERLRKGVVLEDGFIKPWSVEQKEERTYSIIIAEGRKRIIRRLIESSGAKVAQLKRVRIGRLELGNLGIGNYRKLSPKEISKLFS